MCRPSTYHPSTLGVWGPSTRPTGSPAHRTPLVSTTAWRAKRQHHVSTTPAHRTPLVFTTAWRARPRHFSVRHFSVSGDRAPSFATRYTYTLRRAYRGHVRGETHETKRDPPLRVYIAALCTGVSVTTTLSESSTMAQRVPLLYVRYNKHTGRVCQHEGAVVSLHAGCMRATGGWSAVSGQLASRGRTAMFACLRAP